MKILFLDFDGVLHPTGSASVKFSQLPMLEAFLREPPAQNIRIVVSSTWRDAYSLNALRRFFSVDIAPRIVGCTTTLEEYDSDYERGEEIEAWLAEHASSAEWIALDDHSQGFSPRLRSRVLITESSTGLTDESIVRLRELAS